MERCKSRLEWYWAAMGAPRNGQGGTTNTTGYSKPFAGSNRTNAIAAYAVFGHWDRSIRDATNKAPSAIEKGVRQDLGLPQGEGLPPTTMLTW